MSGKMVVVYELLHFPDGSLGIGNSQEVEVAEGILLVEQGLATSVVAPIGKIPEEWEAE